MSQRDSTSTGDDQADLRIYVHFIRGPSNILFTKEEKIDDKVDLKGYHCSRRIPTTPFLGDRGFFSPTRIASP